MNGEWEEQGCGLCVSLIPIFKLHECFSIPTNYRVIGTKEVFHADLHIILDNSWILLPLPNLFLFYSHHFPLALSNGVVEAIGISRNRILFIHLLLYFTYFNDYLLGQVMYKLLGIQISKTQLMHSSWLQFCRERQEKKQKIIINSDKWEYCIVVNVLSSAVQHNWIGNLNSIT